MEDPVEVTKELDRSIRQTVTLANKLEHSANTRPVLHRPGPRIREDITN